MSIRYDDAIVGAGIVGLAHAYHLARRGRKVIVFERSIVAMGASVRNFGMLWPIGQPPGRMLNLATTSLAHWRELLYESGLWHDPCGSLHLAYHDDEADVLREFVADSCDLGYQCELVEPANIGEHTNSVNPDGLKLALWSATEVCVDPRQVLARLPIWLAETYEVTFQFGTAVTGHCAPIVSAGNREWVANHLWVCCGDDFQSLMPDLFADSGLTRCKLQMLRTKPLGSDWQLGPMLAGGLTLRHYASFQRCPSLAAVRERVNRTRPKYDHYGIHVMASQNGSGEITIGDSHQYGKAISAFDQVEIDDLILAYLRTFLRIPEINIGERWHGTYAKHPTLGYFIQQASATATIATGVGGAGMTLSFGFAEKCIQETL